MSDRAIVEKVSSKKPQGKTFKLQKGTGTVICIVLMIVMAAAALMLYQNVVRKGAEALADSYNAAFAAEKDAAYQTLYKKFYDAAESANHVANRAFISIGDIQETEKLEVLRVSDVEFVVEDSGSNSGKITSWLEVPGEGVYVVDLSIAEFIVDNERSHVSVRLPYPELTNVTIDYSNVKKVLFKDFELTFSPHTEAPAAGLLRRQYLAEVPLDTLPFLRR